MKKLFSQRLCRDLLFHQLLGAPVYTTNRQERVEVGQKKISLAYEQIAQHILYSAHLSFWKSQQHSFLFLIPFHHLHSQECHPITGRSLEVWHSKAHLLHGVWEQTIKGYRELLQLSQTGQDLFAFLQRSWIFGIILANYNIGRWQTHATNRWKDVLYPQGRKDILQGPGSHTHPLLTLWEAIRDVWHCLQLGWTAAWAPWCETFEIYLQCWRFQDG